MHTSPVLLASLLLLGSFAGLTTSVLGLGAGLILVPCLLFVLPALGVQAAVLPAVALATSLTVSLLTSLVATHAHWRNGNLAHPFSRVNLALIASAAVGALGGAAVLPSLPARLALSALGLFQLAMGAHLLLRATPRSASAVPAASVSPADTLARPAVRAYFALVGCLASIGLAGSFIVPFLLTLRVPQRNAVALASWLAIGIGGVASATYASHPLPATAHPVAGLFGLVHLPTVALLAVGSFAAARLGAALARRMNPLWLQRIVAVALLASALYTLCVRL